MEPEKIYNIDEIATMHFPKRHSEDYWYRNTDPYIRNYITGRDGLSLSGMGRFGLNRARNEYMSLGNTFRRRSLSAPEMAKYENKYHIDQSLFDVARDEIERDYTTDAEKYQTGRMSDRRWNRRSQRYEQQMENLNENQYILDQQQNPLKYVRPHKDGDIWPALAAIGLPFGIIGGVHAAPYLWQFLNNPFVQAIGTIDGLRNLVTENGIQKTYNHFKNGEYGKGTLSLAGDVLDASPLIGVGKAIKSGNEARKIFGNGIGLDYTMREMPIANLFNRDNRIGFELSKIPFQEPIYRTGYHVTRYAGDEEPYLFPDEYVDNLGNKIKLDNYNPVRDPNDNIPVNTFWLGGDDINYANARPEIGLHVGATDGPGWIRMSKPFNSDKTVPPVVREVSWIDYPGSTRIMPDIGTWHASMENKELWENIGAHIDDTMLVDDLYKSDGWFHEHSTTYNIEALKKANALLNELRRVGITSIQYGNKYEIPRGWKHIDGNLYSTPTGRKIEWPGGESYVIITPESWWSKNRRYTPPVPDQDEVIPFDQYVRNND